MAKLTPAEVQFYLKEAKSCEDRQQRELIQRNNYPFLINYYEGIEQIDVAHPHVATAHRMAIINEYFPNTNSLIAEIMYQNPDFIVEAAKPEAEKGEGLMKAALEYGFEKADALVENRVALFDMFYAGYCAVEIGHLTDKNNETQFKMLPEEGEMEERGKGLVQRMAEKIRSFTKQADNDEEAERKLEEEAPVEEEKFATSEMTYVRRYDPLNVPLDWRAETLKERRYNLKKVWLSKAEFDTKYVQFKDRVSAEEKSFTFSKHDNLIHSKKILIYEFQVRKRSNEYWTIVLTPTVTTEELDIFKRPYTTNGFDMKIGTLHKYGKLYPVAVAQINKKMQDEMNHYIRFQMEVAERNIPKRVADRNKVKGDAIEALNSDKVNDLVLIDGNVSGAITEAPHTNVSLDNKELFAVFQDQKNKLWSVQESRIGGRSVPKFAEELKIQTAGFLSKQIDVQEGLRMLIKEELETFKDIIVKFWDSPLFLKITGGQKPEWYIPKIDPMTGNVLNPLTDLLIGDYFIKVDITSGILPNRMQRRSDAIEFLNMFFQPGVLQLFQSQGKTLNIEEVAKIAKDFGLTPEALFIDFIPPPLAPTGMPSEGQLPPEEDATRQAEAERRARERGIVV